MARSSLTLLLSVALVALVSGHDFLKHLPKIPAAKIANIAKQSPAEIAQTAAKTAAGTARVAKKAAEEGAAEPKKVAEAAEAAVKHVEQEKEAAHALDGAGEVLKHAAQAAAAANASVVAEHAKHAADTALPTGLRPRDIEHASKGDIEDTLRKVTPQAAETVNHMGHKVAREIEKAAPRAADLVNRTGNGFADRMFGPIPEGSTLLPPAIEDKIRGFGVAPILGFLLVIVVGGAVVTLRHMNAAKSRARSPVLLGGGGEYEPTEMNSMMQMPTAGVTQFSRF